MPISNCLHCLYFVSCGQSRDCIQLGPPVGGEVVQVRWTDGQVYGATFVASHVIQMYQVKGQERVELSSLFCKKQSFGSVLSLLG